MNNFTKAFFTIKNTSIKWVFVVLTLFLFNIQSSFGQTLYDSFADGNFTASPVWGGSTTVWGIQTNSDAAAGATGSNTVRLASSAVAATDYLSSQIASWSTSQEWGFWVGRRAQAYTAANQMYIWLYANEANVTNATVDGYRLAIGDDSGGDDIRLEYIVNGSVSSTVITSTGALTNGLTDIGFLVRVTRSSSGVWALFTSTLPTANGDGAIATDVPNSTNAAVSQGSATNNTVVPAANGYIGFAALHTTGASAIIANEIDQIYFTPASTTYTVTYNGNSNASGTPPTDGSSPYASGATVTVLGNTGSLARTGYTFSDWNTLADGSGTDRAAASTFTISANSTLYAKWTGSVTYDGNSNTGGTVPSTATGVIAGATYTVASNSGTLVRTGYTFSGWNTAADGTGTSYTAGSGTFVFAGNTTLYARWTAAVTYNSNSATSGSVPTDSTLYRPGQAVTTAANSGTLARTGYTFAGWNTAADGTGTTYAVSTASAFTISGDVTLYARWTATVTYDANGATSGTVPTDATVYRPGQAVTTAANSGTLGRTGFTFAGWNTLADGTGTTYTVSTASAFTITGNITLYARWTAAVTYDANSATTGTIPTDATAYRPSQAVTTAANSGILARTGYTFAGWNTLADGTGTTYAVSTSSAFTITGNITLFARWTATVTYDANGATSGTVPTDATAYRPSQAVTTAANSGTLAQTGYTFAGWNTQADGLGTTYAVSTAAAFTISGDITLYAKWDLNTATYTVTYDANSATSGTVPTDGTAYSSGAPVTTAANSGSLTRTGYTFAGWNTAANGTGTSYAVSTSSAFTISGDITLYARWTATVTYNANSATSGTVPTDATAYRPGQAVTTAANSGSLARTGFAFSGWNTQADGLGTTYAVSTASAFTISGDITLYAKWNTVYTVTYNANSATSGTAPTDSNAYVSGAPVTTAANSGTLARTGFAFSGWNTQADGLGTSYAVSTASAFTISGDITLYAKWNPVYTVTYNANSATSGTAPTDSNAYASGASVTTSANSGTLARTGYTFAGWNTATDGTGTTYAVSTASAFTITGNITLYARWTATVTFNSNGGTAVTAISGVTPGTTITLPTSPTKANLTFAGWFTDNGTFATAFTAATVVNINVTVFAKWTATVTFNSNGGTSVTAISGITAGTTITLPTAPTKSGLVFGGWFSDNGTFASAFTAATAVNINVTVFAKWTATVTFNSNGGTAVTAISGVTEGATITLPTAPTKASSAFLGWYSDDVTFTTPFTAVTAVTANITVYANWSSVIFSENMGNPGVGNNNASLYTGWQGQGVYTYNASGTNMPTVEITTPSTGSGTYSGASGNANLFISATGGTGNVIFSGIDTETYTNLSLSFGINKSTTSGTGSDLAVEVSADGSTWNTLTLATALPTGAGTAIWYYRSVTGTIPSTTNLRIRFKQTASVTSYRIDDVTLFGQRINEPEIVVRGNNVIIPSGATNTPATNDYTDFGSTTVIGGLVTKTFTIENKGAANLTISSTSDNSSEFSVTQAVLATVNGTTVVSTPNSTTFTVSFDPTSIGIKNAVITVASNDTSEPSYTFNITGTGINSNSSTIIADSGYTNRTDILYKSFQGTTGVASSTTDSADVFQFIIQDGGGSVDDSDALGTKLTDIEFTVSSGFNNILSAALFSGSTKVNSVEPSITGGKITFAGLTNGAFTTTDGVSGTQTITLRLSFKNTSAFITDNDPIRLAISSATADSTGSLFAATDAGGATSSTTAGNNQIEVVADRLAFVTQPPAYVGVNTFMAVAVTVSYNDSNGVRDKDITTPVTMESSGTLVGTPVSSNSVTAGLATFNVLASLKHSATGGPGLFLTAKTVASLANSTQVDSNTFEVGDVSYSNGAWKTKSTGTWTSTSGAGTATWQTFTSSTGLWADAPGASPTASDNVYIAHNVTYDNGAMTPSVWVLSPATFTYASTSVMTFDNMYVFNGGTFQINNRCAIATTTASKGNFELESGGKLIINVAYTAANSKSGGIWQGTEKFRPGSEVIIKKWTANDYLIPVTSGVYAISPVANTANTYSACFGKLTIDMGASGNSNTFFMIEPGTFNSNLTHNDLSFLTSGNFAGFNVRFLDTGGTMNTTIGGNLDIASTFGGISGNTIDISRVAGTSVLNIIGDFKHAGTTGSNFRLTSNTANTNNITLNVDGDMILNGTGSVIYNGSTPNANSTTTINLKGDLSVASTTLLFNSNVSKNGDFNFTGTGDGTTAALTQTIDIASAGASRNQNINFRTLSGSYVKLINQNLELGTNSSFALTAASGTTTTSKLDFGFDGAYSAVTNLSAGTNALNILNVSGATGTTFSYLNGATLLITSPKGMVTTTNASPGNGNVQTNTRTYANQTGTTFKYIGRLNQETGDVLVSGGSNSKNIICDLNTSALTLTLTNSAAVSTLSTSGLYIKNGVFIETDAANMTGTGPLTIDATGTYRSAVVTTTAAFPRMTGTLTYAAGSTIELNAATGTEQTLVGDSNYKNLIFSNGGTKKISTTTSNISGTVTIKDNNTILDVENKTFSGTAGLTMTNNSLFRMSLLNTTLPQLSGTYTLTGGTVELYGSSATQTQSLRGTDGASANINYNNIELNSAGANVAALGANVVAQAGFGIKGTMNVNSPTCFQLGSGYTITDAGATSVFEIKAGATFKYGGSIATSGASGNVRTDTRTFPTTASYGFVGGTTQTTGTGLPSSMVNMYMDKTASTDFVTLSSATAVTGALTFYKGKLDLDVYNLAIGSSGSITGASATDYIVTSNTGTLTRNIAALGTFIYPIGSVTDYNPSTFVWSAAPGITDYSLRYVATTASTGTGLPTTAGCVSASSLLDNGYWTGTSTGTATNSPNITFTRNGHTNAGSNINLHAIVRRDSSASTWGTAGTWSSPTSSALGATSEVTLSQSALALANNFTGEFAIAKGTNDTSTAAVLTSVGASTICSGTSPSLSIAITGSSSLYNIVYSDGTSNFSVTSYSSGTPFAPAAISSNKTFSIVSVTSAGGCTGSGNSGTPTVNVGGTTTYSSGSWSASAPTSTSTAIIDGGIYSVAADINACSLEVKNTAIVNIPSTYKVTLSGALTVETGSSFTLQNDSNLIQSGSTNPNSGSIRVKRNSSPLYLLDYTLWSSPVLNQNLYSFSPNTSTVPNIRFYVYDEPSDLYASIATSNNFNVGQSYLIRAPKTFSDTTPTVFNGTFIGKPNSGNITFAMTKSLNGFNATGNPYPSQINVHDFINANISNITGTLYFWRKRNNPYITNYYATLNLLTYTANSAPGGDTGSTYFNSTTPSDWVINVGQGFIVKATSASNLVFNNSMRRGVNNSNQFFRTSKNLATQISLFKLNLTNTNGVYSQMAIGYSADFTLGIDNGYDGLNINKTDYLCSSIEDTPYSIQARPEFNATDVVPLQYKIENAGNYSISIDQFNGLFTNQDVLLKDNFTNTIHNLKSSPYTFVSEAGSFNNRFEIVYQNQLGVSQPNFNENNVVIYKQNQELIINSGNTMMSKVKVYDIRGRLLFSKVGINASQIKLFTGTTQEVLIVKITSDSDAIVTKKFIN